MVGQGVGVYMCVPSNIACRYRCMSIREHEPNILQCLVSIHGESLSVLVGNWSSSIRLY